MGRCIFYLPVDKIVETLNFLSILFESTKQTIKKKYIYITQMNNELKIQRIQKCLTELVK